MTTTSETAHAKSVLSARGWRSTFASLENSNFRWFWLSTLGWFTGMQMQVFARGWLAYTLTHSSLDLGWVTFAYGLPILVLAPFSGAFTDRVEKRTLLMTTQIGAAVVNLGIAILISLGMVHVWHLMVASAFTGVVSAFNMPGRHTSVPRLVEQRHIMNAVALNSGATNLTNVAAPALAGILVGVIGVSWVYYISVIAFFLAAVFMLMVPRMPPTADTGSSATGVILDGFNYVKANSVISILLLFAFLLTLFGMPYQILMPVFAVDVLKSDASGLGMLMAAVGVGALIGAVGVASLGNYKRKGMLMLASAALFGALLVLFADSTSFGLSLVLLVGVGTMNNFYGATNTSLLLLNTADQMRGRVMGLYMISAGLIPVGVLAAGAIAEYTGVRLAVAIGGIIMVLSAITLTISRPAIRKL